MQPAVTVGTLITAPRVQTAGFWPLHSNDGHKRADSESVRVTVAAMLRFDIEHATIQTKRSDARMRLIGTREAPVRSPAA